MLLTIVSTGLVDSVSTHAIAGSNHRRNDRGLRLERRQHERYSILKGNVTHTRRRGRWYPLLLGHAVLLVLDLVAGDLSLVLDLLLADLLEGCTSVRGNGDGPAEHREWSLPQPVSSSRSVSLGVPVHDQGVGEQKSGLGGSISLELDDGFLSATLEPKEESKVRDRRKRKGKRKSMQTIRTKKNGSTGRRVRAQSHGVNLAAEGEEVGDGLLARAGRNVGDVNLGVGLWPSC